MLSVIIPAYNEELTLDASIKSFSEALTSAGLDFELLVIDDGSSDGTKQKLIELEKIFPSLRHITNEGKHGFGHAVRCGLANYRGDAVSVVMADSSDSPQDLIAYYEKIREGYQCAFGSRFIKGAQVEDYPQFKRMLNRMGNWLIAIMFGQRYYDFTNPFKCNRWFRGSLVFQLKCRLRRLLRAQNLLSSPTRGETEMGESRNSRCFRRPGCIS